MILAIHSCFTTKIVTSILYCMKTTCMTLIYLKTECIYSSMLSVPSKSHKCYLKHTPRYNCFTSRLKVLHVRILHATYFNNEYNVKRKLHLLM